MGARKLARSRRSSRPRRPPSWTRRRGVAVLPDEEMVAIQDHFRQLGHVGYGFHELVSELVHVDVHIVEPNPWRPWYILFTTGMSARPMRVPRGFPERRFAELMLCLPEGWFGEGGSGAWSGPGADPKACWPVLMLQQIARFPHLFRTFLGPEHTITNGVPPWPYDESVCFNGALLLPPDTTPPGFENVCVVGGRRVNLYAAVPLHPAELDLAMQDDLDEVLQRFRAHQVSELLDLDRPSVV